MDELLRIAALISFLLLFGAVNLHAQEFGTGQTHEVHIEKARGYSTANR